MNILETMLIVAGLLHFALVWPAVMVPKVLDWRRDLAGASRMTRHVVWTHGSFIVLVNLSFGALSIAMAGPLASGEPLARAVCGMIALYWSLRLALQLGMFDPREYLRSWWMKAGYHGLTLMFAYFTIVYWLAAVAPGVV